MNIQNEAWANFPIKGYPKYLVSNHGRVSSTVKGPCKILKLRKHHKGYFKVAVSSNKKMRQFFIHRIVALAFIPNPKKYHQINHIDCDKTNNHVSNLEWCDQKGNMKHAKENKLIRFPKGEGCHFAKVKERDVIEIRHKFKNGYTAKMLAKEYGLKGCSIYDIVTRRCWRHVA